MITSDPVANSDQVLTMAFGDRVDDMRFRTPQSPLEEQSFPAFGAPIRGIGNIMQYHDVGPVDSKAILQRRFTTNTVPTLPTITPLSPIGQQRRQAAEASAELTSAVSVFLCIDAGCND
jgi:hypothetical protein